jgi:hypothetical protein
MMVIIAKSNIMQKNLQNNAHHVMICCLFAMTIIIQEPQNAAAKWADAELTHDQVIHHLSELLTLFPPLLPPDLLSTRREEN